MRIVDETGIVDVKLVGNMAQTLKYSSVGDLILLEDPQLVKESPIPLFCMEDKPHLMTICNTFDDLWLSAQFFLFTS
jgi:hypothetical protein